MTIKRKEETKMSTTENTAVQCEQLQASADPELIDDEKLNKEVAELFNKLSESNKKQWLHFVKLLGDGYKTDEAKALAESDNDAIYIPSKEDCKTDAELKAVDMLHKAAKTKASNDMSLAEITVLLGASGAEDDTFSTERIYRALALAYDLGFYRGQNAKKRSAKRKDG